MKNAHLGSLEVSRIGLGAMTMAGTYTSEGALDDAESIRTIHRALDLGVTHIDTAEIYGPFHSEEIVGQAVKGRRDQVVIATKFGLVSHAGGGPGVIDSSPANVRAAVEGSLQAPRHRPHRPATTSTASTRTPRSRRPPARSPTWSPRARCCTSACPRPSPRPSAAPTPCSRSPRCRPSTRCGPATSRPRSCRCCASSASASSPTPRSATACSPGRSAPSTTSPTTTGARPTPASPARTSAATSRIVDEVRAIGAEIGATPAQTALAWLLTRGDDIAPIPGTRRVARVEENTAADGDRAHRRPARPAQQPPARRRRTPRRSQHGLDRPLTATSTIQGARMPDPRPWQQLRIRRRPRQLPCP